MGVDELGVDEMGVDEMGSRRSGTTPTIAQCTPELKIFRLYSETSLCRCTFAFHIRLNFWNKRYPIT